MKKNEAWARFWRGGSLTSFGDNFAAGYAGELRQMWRDFFGYLPDDATIVDLGAGNGALEEIAVAFCTEHGKRMTIHAIDLAPDLPARYKSEGQNENCRIEWRANTRNESTGLPNESADAIIGNFAIEYGNDKATVQEIARLMKPGGAGRFLMHHASSSIILNSAIELQLLEVELKKGGFLDAVRDYLREFGDVRSPEQFQALKQTGRAEPYRQRMNAAHEEAIKHATVENAVILIQQIMQWTGQLVSPPMFFEPKQVLLARLKEVREELQANQSRLQDMQSAAVDEARKERLVEQFESAGLHAAAREFHLRDSDAVVGWLLTAQK